MLHEFHQTRQVLEHKDKNEKESDCNDKHDRKSIVEKEMSSSNIEDNDVKGYVIRTCMERDSLLSKNSRHMVSTKVVKLSGKKCPQVMCLDVSATSKTNMFHRFLCVFFTPGKSAK